MSKYKTEENLYGFVNLYREDDDGTVWLIPMDEANSDYQAYLKSLELEQGEK